MFYTDLEVYYKDGSKGAKRFEGMCKLVTLDQANVKLMEMINTSKFAKKTGCDDAFIIKGHRIESGKI